MGAVLVVEIMGGLICEIETILFRGDHARILPFQNNCLDIAARNSEGRFFVVVPRNLDWVPDLRVFGCGMVFRVPPPLATAHGTCR